MLIIPYDDGDVHYYIYMYVYVQVCIYIHVYNIFVHTSDLH